MKATAVLAAPNRLVTPQDRVELFDVRGNTPVPMGYYSIQDASDLLHITPTWLCNVLTYSKDGTWSNGFYSLRLSRENTGPLGKQGLVTAHSLLGVLSLVTDLERSGLLCAVTGRSLSRRHVYSVSHQ